MMIINTILVWLFAALIAAIPLPVANTQHANDLLRTLYDEGKINPVLSTDPQAKISLVNDLMVAALSALVPGSPPPSPGTGGDLATTKPSADRPLAKAPPFFSPRGSRYFANLSLAHDATNTNHTNSTRFNAASNKAAAIALGGTILLEVVAGVIFLSLVCRFIRLMKDKAAERPRRLNAEQERAIHVLNNRPEPLEEIELVNMPPVSHSPQSAHSSQSAPDQGVRPNSPALPERVYLSRSSAHGSESLGAITEMEAGHDAMPVEPWTPLPASPVAPVSPTQPAQQQEEREEDLTILLPTVYVPDSPRPYMRYGPPHTSDQSPYERYHSFALL
ncbi:hypothetical protein F5Y17DRAFT_252370 [Xylariaceae sp. FL0594]|nr:hypothetical protein F5Y17DRAFT_252370 [Xylariaceae sp. FL0594]